MFLDKMSLRLGFYNLSSPSFRHSIGQVDRGYLLQISQSFHYIHQFLLASFNVSFHHLLDFSTSLPSALPPKYRFRYSLSVHSFYVGVALQFSQLYNNGCWWIFIDVIYLFRKKNFQSESWKILSSEGGMWVAYA